MLAMSSLVEAGKSMQREPTSADLYHDVTYTLVYMSQIFGSYYVVEQDLDCLLLRGKRQIGEGIDLEQELDDKEIQPLIDLINADYNGSKEYE